MLKFVRIEQEMVVNIAILVATIALFVSGERNVNVARKSAGAAKDAADAAQGAVKLSEKIAERQLRAYVLAIQANVNHAFDGVPRAFVLVKNTGQTPAYGV